MSVCLCDLCLPPPQRYFLNNVAARSRERQRMWDVALGEHGGTRPTPTRAHTHTRKPPPTVRPALVDVSLIGGAWDCCVYFTGQANSVSILCMLAVQLCVMRVCVCVRVCWCHCSPRLRAPHGAGGGEWPPWIYTRSPPWTVRAFECWWPPRESTVAHARTRSKRAR